MPIVEAPKAGSLILVLTCKLSPPERVASAKQQIAPVFPSCDFQVVDGYISSDPIVDTIIDRRKMSLHSKRPMTLGEVATYATHRLAWETLLQSEAEYALFLEDDFQFVAPQIVAGCFKDAAQFFASGCDIVKLFDFPRDAKSDVAVRRKFANVDLIKWERPRAGMVAYLMSRKGAEKLLNRKSIFRVVDEDTKYYWEMGLDIWSVLGNPVTDASANLGGSLLENDRLKSKKRSIFMSLHGFCLTSYRSAKNAYEFRKYRIKHKLRLEKMVGPEGLEPPTKRL